MVWRGAPGGELLSMRHTAYEACAASSLDTVWHPLLTQCGTLFTPLATSPPPSHLGGFLPATCCCPRRPFPCAVSEASFGWGPHLGRDPPGAMLIRHQVVRPVSSGVAGQLVHLICRFEVGAIEYFLEETRQAAWCTRVEAKHRQRHCPPVPGSIGYHWAALAALGSMGQHGQHRQHWAARGSMGQHWQCWQHWATLGSMSTIGNIGVA